MTETFAQIIAQCEVKMTHSVITSQNVSFLLKLLEGVLAIIN